MVPEYDVPALHAFNDSLATYLAGLALLHKAKAHVIAQTDWCQARRPRPGARLSYPGKKDKKISYMLSRQRYAEWLPTALNVTGCSTCPRPRHALAKPRVQATATQGCLWKPSLGRRPGLLSAS